MCALLKISPCHEYSYFYFTFAHVINIHFTFIMQVLVRCSQAQEDEHSFMKSAYHADLLLRLKPPTGTAAPAAAGRGMPGSLCSLSLFSCSSLI